jgi:hypothetical protein
MNVNAQHSWMDPSTAQRVMAPLIHLKGNIIRDWFDQECADEVSLDELSGLFAKITRPGPSIVPAGTSQEAPSTEDTNEALSGVNVIQWFPSPEQWNIFSRKRTELMKTERIWQPEGAGTTTEDVAPENPVRTPLVALWSHQANNHHSRHGCLTRVRLPRRDSGAERSEWKAGGPIVRGQRNT